MILNYTAEIKDEGRTIKSVLFSVFNLSASMVRRLKAVQGIFKNGEPAYVTVRLIPGDVVTAAVEMAEHPCDNHPETGPLEILMEDEGLLAVNKPAGVLVHPSQSRYAGTLSNFVTGYLQARGELAACHAVNRLDRDTSGVVLFAKNSYMKERLCEALKDSEKRYIGWACGCPDPAEGMIDRPIRREREMEMRRIIAEDGQRAVTHYAVQKVLELNGETLSLINFQLETGRTHQIRVHAASLGCPLLGDGLYADDGSRALSEKLGITRQQLHACSLTFRHPLTGETVRLKAPLPEDFYQAKALSECFLS